MVDFNRIHKKKRTAFPKEHGPPISAPDPLHGRAARTGTPYGIRRHHQNSLSKLFIFLFLHKKTDHTTSGMIRIRFLSVVISVHTHKHRNANADHYSQLCQRQVKAVFSMRFINYVNLSNSFPDNLAVRTGKFKWFFQKKRIFFIGGRIGRAADQPQFCCQRQASRHMSTKFFSACQ